MVKPEFPEWELDPFLFRFDWVHDPEYGWVEFYWFGDDLFVASQGQLDFVAHQSDLD